MSERNMDDEKEKWINNFVESKLPDVSEGHKLPNGELDEPREIANKVSLIGIYAKRLGGKGVYKSKEKLLDLYPDQIDVIKKCFGVILSVEEYDKMFEEK